MKGLLLMFSTTVIYLFIMIAIRILGKTAIEQFSMMDLEFIILVSNVVQNPMVGSHTSQDDGLVSAATLFIVYLIFTCWMYRIFWLS